MELWRTNRLKRLNILEGSVSSGKTWVSLVLWAFWVKTMPKGKNHLYLMCGKSRATLKHNCLGLLQELVGEANFTYGASVSEGQLFGRRVLFESAYDVRSESKIRGITLQGAYCDEITELDRAFFAMLLSRLRLPGAKLFGTTNPGSPGHWLKTEYLDRGRELDMLDMKFLIDDNTALDRDYVKNIKREYTGVFYKRFILGLWIMAEGSIYPMYEDALVDEPPPGDPEEWSMSLDYGTQNPFAAMLWARWKDDRTWYAVGEYYYSGRDTGRQKTDQDYANDLQAFTRPVKEWAERRRVRGELFGQYTLETIIDPSAASFIALLQRDSFYYVRGADNDVLDGIRETAGSLQNGYIKILRKCENWTDEAKGYVWANDDAADVPVKENDHAMDATRYFVKTKNIVGAFEDEEYQPLWN